MSGRFAQLRSRAGWMPYFSIMKRQKSDTASSLGGARVVGKSDQRAVPDSDPSFVQKKLHAHEVRLVCARRGGIVTTRSCMDVCARRSSVAPSSVTLCAMSSIGAIHVPPSAAMPR